MISLLAYWFGRKQGMNQNTTDVWNNFSALNDYSDNWRAELKKTDFNSEEVKKSLLTDRKNNQVTEFLENIVLCLEINNYKSHVFIRANRQ